MQYVGLVYLFAIYIFQGLKFILWDLPKQKKRDLAKKEEVERVTEFVDEIRAQLSTSIKASVKSHYRPSIEDKTRFYSNDQIAGLPTQPISNNVSPTPASDGRAMSFNKDSFDKH